MGESPEEYQRSWVRGSHSLFLLSQTACTHLSDSFWLCSQGRHLCRNHHTFCSLHYNALSLYFLPKCRTAPLTQHHLPASPQSTCLAPTMGLAARCLGYVITLHPGTPTPQTDHTSPGQDGQWVLNSVKAFFSPWIQFLKLRSYLKKKSL